MIEQVKNNDQILAIIIRSDFKTSGITFCTPSEFSQQLAYMNHPSGKLIQPHVHNQVSREVFLTQEVLFIKSGKLRVDLYSDSRQYLESKILTTGDVILLASGGHGFEMIEPTEIIEVKQGPYLGDQDKTRFDDTDNKNIVIK